MMVNDKEALGEEILPDLAGLRESLRNYEQRKHGNSYYDKRIAKSLAYHLDRNDFLKFAIAIAEAPENQDKIPEKVREALWDLLNVAEHYPYSESAKEHAHKSLLRILDAFDARKGGITLFNVENNHAAIDWFSPEETRNGLADKTVPSVNGSCQSVNGDGRVPDGHAVALAARWPGEKDQKAEFLEFFDDPRDTFKTMDAAVMYNKVIPFQNSFHPHAEQVLWRQVANSPTVAGQALDRMQEMYRKGCRLYLGPCYEGVGLRENAHYYDVNTSNPNINHVVAFKLDDLKQWKIWKLDL